MKPTSLTLVALLIVLAAALSGLYLWLRAYSPPDPPVDDAIQEETAVVGVYFTRVEPETSFIRLVSVTRVMPPEVDPLRGAIIELLEGPTGEERAERIMTAVPEGTRLLRAWIEDEIAHLDFNEHVEAGGGSASMFSRLSQILYTATQFDDVHGVELLIEGERPEMFSGEGIILDSPMRRPAEEPVF